MRKVLSNVAAALTVCAALLLFLPGLEQPFSTPKSWALWAGAAASLLLLSRRPRMNAAIGLAGAQLLWLSVSSLLGDVASPHALLVVGGGAALLVAWTVHPPKAEVLVTSIAVGSTLIAAVALLQFFGLDVIGAQTNGARLRMYGTLGNPDFVAAVLVPGMAVTAARVLSAKRRSHWIPALALQLSAVVLVNSFASLLALAAVAVVVALREARVARFTLFGGALIVLAAAVPIGRSPVTSAKGRAYLHAVVASHLFDVPLGGKGPGAVEAFWPLWEVELWKARCGDDAGCVAGHPDRPFAALQDHVHDDFAERLIEQGVPGVLLLLGLFAVLFATGWKREGLFVTAALAGLAAIAVRALFDFPLARPAELCVVAALAAIVTSEGETE